MSFDVSTSEPFDARRLDPRVRQVMRILEFEQTVVPGVDELAERVALSPFHLSRVFAEEVGESIAAYGRRIRLDNSNHQMIHDTVPLDGVAAAFGYASQAAYTRAYTRQFGMPPRQYVEAILGRTQADFAASNLGPAGGPSAASLLADKVSYKERPSLPALARRFYGHDVLTHWRTFIADLPPGLADGTRLAGMAYDNVRITPAKHWRYDCALVFDDHRRLPLMQPGKTGLDPVEVPGGLHAEMAVQGSFAQLWRTTVGLLSEWLPAHPEYAPEGDPVVGWFAEPPVEEPFASIATIRIRPRGTAPAYNLPPLTRHGRQAGSRTDPGAR